MRLHPRRIYAPVSIWFLINQVLVGTSGVAAAELQGTVETRQGETAEVKTQKSRFTAAERKSLQGSTSQAGQSSASPGEKQRLLNSKAEQEASDASANHAFEPGQLGAGAGNLGSDAGLPGPNNTRSERTVGAGIETNAMPGVETKCQLQEVNNVPFASRRDGASTGKQFKPIEGGVKDEQSLIPSLKLQIGKQQAPFHLGLDRDSLWSGTHELTQFLGPVRLGPDKPQLDQSQPNQSGVIAPISSYTLKPHNALIWTAPGFEFKPSQAQAGSVQGQAIESRNGITSWSTGYEATRQSCAAQQPVCVSTKSGVTTWIAGYQVANVQENGPGPIVVGRGVTTFVRVYEVNSVLAQNAGSSAQNCDLYVQSSHGITELAIHALSSSSTTPIAYGNGVVSWSPGFQVAASASEVVKETLGGAWSSNRFHAPEMAAFPKGNSELVQITGMPMPLVASAKLLPGLTAPQRPRSWDSWYSQTAQCLYSRWQDVEAGAGTAKMNITVNKYRSVFCQCVGFEPAAGTAPSREQESAFRETAVSAINSLSRFEIPEFPKDANCNEINFTIEMKRTVDGAKGFQVTRS